MATDALNATPNLKFKDGQTPLESFSNTKIASNPKHWHHFGCPAYTLSQELQTDTSIYHKWKARSRVGVYLGRSPQHARDVSLVLNLETGLVSPQFHVKLDSTFQTLREEGAKMPPLLWQQKCGFIAHTPVVKSSHRDSVTSTDKTPEAPPPADHEGDSPDEDPQHTQRETPENPEEPTDMLPPIR